MSIGLAAYSHKCVAINSPIAAAEQTSAQQANKKDYLSMQTLLPRHVEPEESARLGVESGWYATKVSGTFVTGPHATEEDCKLKIAELGKPTAPRKS